MDAAPAPEDGSTVEYAEDDDKTTPFDDDLRYQKTLTPRFRLMVGYAGHIKYKPGNMGRAIDALRKRFGNPLMYAHQSDAERLLRSKQVAEGQRQLELLLDLIEASARANAYVFRRNECQNVVSVTRDVIELRARRVDGRYVVKCATSLVHRLISKLHVKRVPLLDDIWWHRATASSEVSGSRAMVSPEMFIDLQAEAAAALRQEALAELEHYKSSSCRGSKRFIFEPMTDLLARGDDAVFSTSALDMVIMTQRPLTRADHDALPQQLHESRKRHRSHHLAGS